MKKLLKVLKKKVIKSKINLYALLKGLKIKKKLYMVLALHRESLPCELRWFNEDIINCILEIKGSYKIGKYMPGTNIPIINENIMNKNLIIF